jgi:hypothetical protein
LLCAADFSALPAYAKALVRTLNPDIAFLGIPMSSPDN